MLERIREWLRREFSSIPAEQIPSGDSLSSPPKTPYLPSGSPLAGQVGKAVEAELTMQVGEAVRKAAEEKRAAVEKVEKAEQERQKAEEVRRALEEKFQTLGIMEIVRDVRDNVWKGGEVTAPLIHAGPESGTIKGQIVFRYPSATDGYWARTEDYGHMATVIIASGIDPKIYTEKESFEITLQYERGKPAPFTLVGTPVMEEEEAIARLKESVVEDSKQRILDGRLPLSNLITMGQKTISEVRQRFGYFKVRDAR